MYVGIVATKHRRGLGVGATGSVVCVSDGCGVMNGDGGGHRHHDADRGVGKGREGGMNGKVKRKEP